MFSRMNRRGGHYLLLGAVAGLLFLTNLGGASLWDLDEGRNATAACEMLESGNWVVPTFNAQLRAHKPALLYWLQVAAYRVFGISEFAARLPCALAALATVLVAYELARALFDRATALLAGIILASTPMICGAARFANPDALLNLCTTLTFLAFWLCLTKPSRLTFTGLGIAAGLAVLAKGPVGFVVPAAVFGLYLLWQRELARLLDRRWLHAVIIMLLVALPWYILVAVETRSGFLSQFFMQHNVQRFLEPMENHRGSPLYYPLVLLVGLTPWSIFLGPALWYGIWSAVRTPRARWQAVWQRAAEPRADRYRLLLAWLATYLVFFTFAATKLPNYVLPAVVPLTLLLARFLERWRRGELSVPVWVPTCSLVCLLAVGLALGAGLTIASGAWLPVPLRDTYAGLEAWAWLGLVPVAAALVGLACLQGRRRTGLVVSVASGAVLLLTPLAAYTSAVFNRYKAPGPLVAEAGALRRDEDMRIGCWNLEHLPSLNFYVRRDVIHHAAAADAIHFLRWPVPVYLFVPAADWERLEPQAPPTCRVVARHAEMYHHGDVVVVTNR